MCYCLRDTFGKLIVLHSFLLQISRVRAPRPFFRQPATAALDQLSDSVDSRRSVLEKTVARTSGLVRLL